MRIKPSLHFCLVFSTILHIWINRNMAVIFGRNYYLALITLFLLIVDFTDFLPLFVVKKVINGSIYWYFMVSLCVIIVILW